jgi:hypothetical protein
MSTNVVNLDALIPRDDFAGLWAQGPRAAVPEPSTWAMLLIGVSGLAFAGVSQSQRVARRMNA